MRESSSIRIEAIGKSEGDKLSLVIELLCDIRDGQVKHNEQLERIVARREGF